MSMNKAVLVVLFSLLTLMLYSCAGNIPESERLEYLNDTWGQSFKQARDSQILNPEAGKKIRPIYGLWGETAVIGVDNYQKLLRKEAPKAPVTTTR